MAYLSINFSIPDGLEEPNSIDLCSVHENEFFLRLTYDKEIRYIFPPKMHVIYDEFPVSFRHRVVDIFSDLLKENLNGLQKEDEKELVSKKFSKRSRSKKS